MLPVRFSRSARKHRIGKAHALEAMGNAGTPQIIPADTEHDERLLWIGPDDRGVELEVIGIECDDMLLVIHVMPYAYRRRPQS
ncbi:hypothetical protein [Haloactinomyces albus]|uniref:DUF4258 domain-containing protein n=1 Tax=Haloactinomyces albus TaxID=1352928 RepID=A0AAE3Z8C4_9ACTN|nr:hypothetical protein [Haloactinomyces albus]MDR7300227.1 hypothetical protein [Haloactinomyces albus]